MTSRSKKEASSSQKKRSSSKIPKRRVIIVKTNRTSRLENHGEGKRIKGLPLSLRLSIAGDVLSEESDGNPTFVQLRHPSSGIAATFLLNSENTRIQEVIQFSDNKRSYFIDETVSSDGNMYICTPIDPLFLVLPYLMKSKRCCPLDQTLADEEFPEIGRLAEFPMDVSLIGDRRGDESLKAYIYNEGKTLLWLQVKLERLVCALKAKNINTSKTVAVSANFVKSVEDEDSGVNYMRYAYGMLLDYIPEELADKLADFVKLPPEPEKNNKRKEIVSPAKPNGKRAKIEEEDDQYESKTPITKLEKKTPTLKEQKLAKAAKGTKSISSFFKKK